MNARPVSFPISRATMLVLLALAAACGDEGLSLPVGSAEPGELTSAYTASGVHYDNWTHCDVGGISMHCCRGGYAMIGARLDYNVFKCAAPGGGVSGSRVLGSGRFCAANQVMVGYSESFERALCQKINGAKRFDVSFRDRLSQDGWPMHICQVDTTAPPVGLGYGFMTAIDTDGSFFCAY
jgi:hypothetical protein